MKQQIYVLDTSALLGGVDPNFLIGVELITVPEAINEIKTSKIREKVEISIRCGQLKIMSPSDQALDSISQACKKSGDFKFLSSVDKSILALAKMLKDEGKQPTILTDDYSIQNVAAFLLLDFQPIQEKGIKKVLKWTIYCPGCQKTFSSKTDLKKCNECGTKLKRYSSNGMN